MTTEYRDTLALRQAVHRLDLHADIDEGDVVTIDGTNWTGLDLQISVVENLTRITGRQVMLHKVTKRDVSLMLAAYGASAFMIQQHARSIASMVRSDIARHTWGAWL
jgi:hypothetical protein